MPLPGALAGAWRVRGHDRGKRAAHHARPQRLPGPRSHSPPSRHGGSPYRRGPNHAAVAIYTPDPRVPTVCRHVTEPAPCITGQVHRTSRTRAAAPPPSRCGQKAGVATRLTCRFVSFPGGRKRTAEGTVLLMCDVCDLHTRGRRRCNDPVARDVLSCGWRAVRRRVERTEGGDWWVPRAQWRWRKDLAPGPGRESGTAGGTVPAAPWREHSATECGTTGSPRALSSAPRFPFPPLRFPPLRFPPVRRRPDGAPEQSDR